MPRCVQKRTGEACGVRLYSVGVLSAIIFSWFQPAMVDVALVGPRLSLKVLVPEALHACIMLPSAAPIIAHGYAAVRPSLSDAESHTILHCSAQCQMWLLQAGQQFIQAVAHVLFAMHACISSQAAASLRCVQLSHDVCTLSLIVHLMLNCQTSMVAMLLSVPAQTARPGMP